MNLRSHYYRLHQLARELEFMVSQSADTTGDFTVVNFPVHETWLYKEYLAAQYQVYNDFGAGVLGKILATLDYEYRQHDGDHIEYHHWLNCIDRGIDVPLLDEPCPF